MVEKGPTFRVSAGASWYLTAGRNSNVSNMNDLVHQDLRSRKALSVVIANVPLDLVDDGLKVACGTAILLASWPNTSRKLTISKLAGKYCFHALTAQIPECDVISCPRS